MSEFLHNRSDFNELLAIVAEQRGEMTQTPIEVAFNTGIRRISRKLALGNKVVHFEKLKPELADWGSYHVRVKSAICAIR